MSTLSLAGAGFGIWSAMPPLTGSMLTFWSPAGSTNDMPAHVVGVGAASSAPAGMAASDPATTTASALARLMVETIASELLRRGLLSSRNAHIAEHLRRVACGAHERAAERSP